MNPEQLWETTLDPSIRTLLQLKIEDAINADETFKLLMGGEVEPRKKFIEDNDIDNKKLVMRACEELNATLKGDESAKLV